MLKVIQITPITNSLFTGRCQIKVDESPIPSKMLKKGIRFHTGLTAYVLKKLGKIVDAQDKDGKIYHLNKKSYTKFKENYEKWKVENKVPDISSIKTIKSSKTSTLPFQIDATKIKECSFIDDPTTNMTTLKIGDGEIVLCRKNDISAHPADVIVNAANSEMLGGSGVDGAITSAGGDVLAFFRRLVPKTAKGRCPEGEVRLTDAGQLPAKICAHAVGPRFSESKHAEQKELLKKTYQSVFSGVHDFITYLAEKNKNPNDPRRPLLLSALIKEHLRDVNERIRETIAKKDDADQSKKIQELKKERKELIRNFGRISDLSEDYKKLLKDSDTSQKLHEAELRKKIENGESLSISFPTISTGIFGYPKEEGALIALETAVTYLQEHQGDKSALKRIQIVFVNAQENENSDVPYYLKTLKELSDAWNANKSESASTIASK